MSASGQVAKPTEEINFAKEILYVTQTDLFAEIGVSKI